MLALYQLSVGENFSNQKDAMKRRAQDMKNGNALDAHDP